MHMQWLLLGAGGGCTEGKKKSVCNPHFKSDFFFKSVNWKNKEKRELNSYLETKEKNVSGPREKLLANVKKLPLALMIGHLGVIISNGAKRGNRCCEAQARVSSKRPWASWMSLSLGGRPDFLSMHPTPASAVPKHSQLWNETILGTAFLCPRSIFSGAVEG